MNFQFSSLLGAPYRGGNLLIHENDLLTPVGNRVSQVGGRLAAHDCSVTAVEAYLSLLQLAVA